MHIYARIYAYTHSSQSSLFLVFALFEKSHGTSYIPEEPWDRNTQNIHLLK